jgi:hypothetical protein
LAGWRGHITHPFKAAISERVGRIGFGVAKIAVQRLAEERDLVIGRDNS